MLINVIGPFAIEAGDRRHTISSKQARTLLTLLALSPGKVVSTEFLIDEMWREVEVGNCRNALQATVTRLRRSLRDLGGGEEVLRTGGGGYRLDITPLDVDCFQFVTLLRRADSLSLQSPAEAIGLIETALALWRGPALDGLADLPLLRAEQARLNEVHMGALELLVELRLGLGDIRTALTDLRHLVEVHENRERLSELLMIALYRDGRQSEALDVFHRARHRLQSELGVDPGSGLRQLHQAVLRHDSSLDLISMRRSV